MKAKELLVEFYDHPGDLSMEYDEHRRPKLTLEKLRGLRMARDRKRVEEVEHLEFLPKMYKPAPKDGML